MQTIMTECGKLVIQHTTDELRKKEILPCVFHANGTPKSVPLEHQTDVETPVGIIPAELVTFHANGMVNRVFPLNGKLSGYWGEADEMALAKQLSLLTPVGPITARIISVGFYGTGELRSLTLWPGEEISVPTPFGHIKARIGISFSQTGTLHSLEPVRPTRIMTHIGEIVAYDQDAVGVNGDSNSLVFASDGSVQRIRTTQTCITVVTPEGQRTVYAPQSRESYCSEEETEVESMEVIFSSDQVAIKNSSICPEIHIPLPKHVFFTRPHLPQLDRQMKDMRCSVQAF